MNPTGKTALAPKKQTIIIKEMMTIESNKVRYVIGREYSNLNRLKEVYGVDITLVPAIGGCQVIIEGPIDMVPAAKKDIKEGTPCTKSFYVERDYIRRIIGRREEDIRSLEKAHGVTISFSRKDGKIIVTGNISGCEACQNAIEALIRNEFWEEFYIPSDLVKFVIGKNFSTWSRIELTYGVEVFLPRSGRSRIWLRGPTAEKVSAAKRDILETLPVTLRWDLGEDFADGTIIGSGGDRIQRLCKEYGVEISLKKGGKVYIWGEKSHSEAARDKIIAIIFGELEKTGF